MEAAQHRGFDSSGAGIQADIAPPRTACSPRRRSRRSPRRATLGVTGVLDADPAFVAKQIDAVLRISACRREAGMVSSAAIIEAVADTPDHAAANIVVDPVMQAASGFASSRRCDRSFEGAPVAARGRGHAEHADAAVLAGFEVVDEAPMERAALRLAEAGAGAALVKGGHRHDRADDVLVTAEGDVVWLRAPRVDTENAHGRCTLSSAIACGSPRVFRWK
ncbi:MAG: bifunctional hydroxymethylpyrimidine kinase/phosphomethylpyrimidine kinase [Eggerthellaceae bacterium]